jgi:glycerol-3-phosphate acyltransferase PlsY
MFTDIPVYPLLLAIVSGYLFGSIPVAALVSRRRNVDIFSRGSRLAGAGNVFYEVGHLPGIIVFSGDFAKGLVAISVAYSLGVEGYLLLLPACATIAGHWLPLFARFRGGDGLSSLMGITVALLPTLGILAVVTGGIVAIIAKGTGHHPTLWGGTAGYGFLLIRSSAAENSALVIAVVLLALIVLVRSVIGHKRRGAESV